MFIITFKMYNWIMDPVEMAQLVTIKITLT